MPTPHHSVFAGRVPFLLPNQQHQSTEGIKNKIKIVLTTAQYDSSTPPAVLYLLGYIT